MKNLAKLAAPCPDGALLAAIRRKSLAEALLAISQGADVDAQDPDTGFSALTLAVKRKQASIVHALLDAGADAEKRNRDLSQPVYHAILSGSPELLSPLLRAGSIGLASTGIGSLSDIARLNNKPALAQWLESEYERGDLSRGLAPRSGSDAPSAAKRL